MPRVLSDLEPGTTVILDETIDGVVEQVPYYYLGLNASGSSILLRKEAALAKRMNPTNESTYDGCEADLYLEDEETGFMSRFSAAMRAAIQSTEIKLYHIADEQTITIARRCFLLSNTEVGYATMNDEGTSFLPALQAATGLSNANSARIARNNNNISVYAWLRSAYSDTNFSGVSINGDMCTYAATYNACWLRPALSVAPATIVSEQGEETIYLFPDASKTYREVDAVAYIGSSARRPKKARLMLDAKNCTRLDVYVSNNSRDESPVWTQVEVGVATTLPNAMKGTDEWELGVKIYAQSGGKAIIGEPALLVELEDE